MTMQKDKTINIYFKLTIFKGINVKNKPFIFYLNIQS